MIEALQPVEFRQVPLHLIDEPQIKARTTMNEAQLEELSRDIARVGVTNPLLVGRVGDRYEIIAGHRRSKAARMAGLVAVPCLVYASVSAAHERVKWGENYYREGLNPADEAILFAELLERDCENDVDRLCAQLGIKRSYAEGRLLLLGGDPDVLQALKNEAIGVGIAQELNRCGDPGHRRYLLDCAVRGGATRAVVSGWLQQWEAQQRQVSGAPAPSAEAAPAAAVPALNYFVCYACKGTEHVETMRPINFHTHCLLATVDKALAQYARRGDVLTYPRSNDEARALIVELVERFPDAIPVHSTP